MLLDTLTAAVFRTLSELRGARAFHPRGAAYEATWAPVGDGALGVDGAATASAVVRVSRGVGLPPALPDVLGVAVKVLDLHGPVHDQDLLLASVAGGTLGDRLLTARRRFAGTRFSTLLPYRVDGQRSAIVGTVEGEPDTTPHGSRSGDGVQVQLSLRSGTPLGVVTLGDRLPQWVAADLRFDPWHTGDDIQPVGLLNRLRRPAYRASQRGRDAPAEGARRPTVVAADQDV